MGWGLGLGFGGGMYSPAHVRLSLLLIAFAPLIPSFFFFVFWSGRGGQDKKMGDGGGVVGVPWVLFRWGGGCWK